MPMTDLEEKCVDAIRFLSADAIQRARSGHPGLPMGAAPLALALWDRHLRHNPADPLWPDRDRFVLSAGHGSMLLYSLLHLSGYESVGIDDIREFRQWGSRTPGHPENGRTPGVEVTTGPLGQGFANAVGMAISEAWLAARFNRPGFDIIDHYIYTLIGDGCAMEGITAEAASLAGHLGLGRLVALYDDNRVTIDGPTDLAFSEDVGARFEASGWHVQLVEDGDRDLDAISEAIARAREVTDRPSLIRVRTTIGFGAPGKQGSAETHGAPLGEEELQAARRNRGWEHAPFEVPGEVCSHMQKARERGAAAQAEWQGRLDRYRDKHPQESAELERLLGGELADGWESSLPSFNPEDSPAATRALSGACLNALADRVPLIGGSADLSPSNKTLLIDSGDFNAEDRRGRNLRFGVREHAMGGIVNGIALHGCGLKPYCGTFLVFADYMRAAIRIAALSGADPIFVMTHDSVAVGEDGPTHQPIEQLASLRAIPDLVVVRPADGNETAGAYRAAVPDRRRPYLLALSRQKLPQLAGTSAEGVQRGAYVLSGGEGTPDLVLIGTGAELSLCVEAAEQLREDGRRVRVVSMPSVELFCEQDEPYRESVLPAKATRRVIVEAGASLGWHRWATPDGAVIGIDRFGASAPGPVCLEKLGFTAKNVAATARSLLE
ncbi:MAG: transketolase [Polyangia bacterium]